MRRGLGCLAVMVLVGAAWAISPDGAGGEPPPPTVTVGNVSVVEGNDGHRLVGVPVTLSTPLSSDLMVSYVTVSGLAAGDADFKPKAGKVRLRAGKTSAKASIPIYGDTAVEGDESFTVTLLMTDSPDVVVAPVVGTVTIVDDDAPPYGEVAAPTVAIGDATRLEGPAGKSKAALPLTLSHPQAADLFVTLHTSDGTATSLTDYKPLSKAVKIKAGKTAANVSITLYGDADGEDDESFTVELTATNAATVAIARATGTITLVDDDSSPATAPAAPTAPTATLTGSEPAQLGLVDVGWAPPASDGGSPITGYLLEVSHDGTNWSTATTVDETVTSFTHDCGLPSITCRYRVSATNSVGSSPPSPSSVPVTTQAPVPPTPTNLPLGNARNYLGLGNLGTGAANTAYEKERMWLGVSGYCTDAYQGDLVAARYFNSDSENPCTGQLNPNWRDTNYEYYVDLPAGRTYDTDVVIYHGNFVRNADCGGSPNANTPNEFCPAGNSGPKPLMPTTMTLYKADATPVDDSDNPTMASQSACRVGTGSGTKTFNPISPSSSAAESNYVFDPSPGNFINTGTTVNSSWYRICQIPSSAPAGRYILRVRNQASTSGAAAENNGSNAFGIVATPSTVQRLCDARTDTTCPKVYAKDFLSVYTVSAGPSTFPLAELGPELAGRTIRVQFWDAVEGATELRIKKPTGTNAWIDQLVNYTSSCGPSNVPGASGSNVPALTNGGLVLPFNGCLLSITFTLPANYNPPADNHLWRFLPQYTASATDRTTFSVTVVG